MPDIRNFFGGKGATQSTTASQEPKPVKTQKSNAKPKGRGMDESPLCPQLKFNYVQVNVRSLAIAKRMRHHRKSNLYEIDEGLLRGPGLRRVRRRRLRQRSHCKLSIALNHSSMHSQHLLQDPRARWRSNNYRRLFCFEWEKQTQTVNSC